MYQRVGAAAYKVDLSNTQILSSYLERPENAFKSIHVAGTNGKGSTSHMLASVLQEQGYKVGLYTSPHLKDFRERIKVNGKMIAKRSVSAFVTKHRSFFEANQLSFFEMTVGLAFDFFRKEKVDIAIIETGLGGRLDSTNIISPLVCVITNIGLDHTQFLGDTLVKIAQEKAGIIKSETPVVIGEASKETKPVFLREATKNRAPIIFAEEQKYEEYAIDLLGDYQQKNLRTVLATLQVITNNGLHVSQTNLKKGLKKVVANTGLLGRWQVLGEAPKVICDTAHNREGLVLTMKQLKEETFNSLHIVMGVVNDKDLETILNLFPEEARYYFCKPSIARGLEAKVLQRKALKCGLKGDVFPSVRIAYKAALAKTTEGDIIYVGGSTFVVAEVL